MNAPSLVPEGPHFPSSSPAPLTPSRKVRVLFINDTARNGGPGRSLHSILKFLDPGVVHRAVVLPREGAIADLLRRDAVADELRFETNLVENPIEPWRRSMERRDFDVALPLKALRLGGNVFKAARAMARLAALVRRGAFDLIYCNGTNADFAGGALSRMTGVPALWHVRYTSIPRPVAGLHRRLAAGPGVRRIVCVSRAAARLFPHCESKVRVIHNALDVAAFDPAGVAGTLRAELGLPPDTVVFGSHGRVLRRKGYIEMIHAARRAIDAMAPAERERAAFVVVGDTPEDFRPDHVEECRRLIAGLGLEERFRMLGFRADVRPLVADFDVAVVPSVYADPLPRAVIESMAMSKPVIAYAVGGVVEMLDALTGELVPFDPIGDGKEGATEPAIDRLAAAMVRYARDPALRASQGAAGRERVVRDFDARAHAARIQREIVSAAGLARSPGGEATAEGAAR
ncbi:MAG TPA: glycosyltransferase [Polyangiaceae bacterium]|jgi:glycosyltransferase involved in cell wall biosynthesis|nr:glycosyltransferase [Polyangiaceae bacterium]